MLGRFWEGFGKPKWMPKSIFRRFFFDAFFERVLTSILGGFSEPRNLTNQQKPLFFQWFLLIFTKSTFLKNVQKNMDFGSIFGGQNNEKTWKHSVEKHVFFELGILCVFFRIFAILARFWTLPGHPKIDKKSKKSCLGRFWNAFRFLYRFWKMSKKSSISGPFSEAKATKKH